MLSNLELLLEDLAILPLVVDDRPDVLLLLLWQLVGLKAVVELLDLVELDVAALFEFADFAFASCVELYWECLVTLRRVHVGDEVNWKSSAFLDICDRVYDVAAVYVHSCAVGVAFVLEIEHLLPYSVAVLWLLFI